jgi:hypothetical protein
MNEENSKNSADSAEEIIKDSGQLSETFLEYTRSILEIYDELAAAKGEIKHGQDNS